MSFAGEVKQKGRISGGLALKEIIKGTDGKDGFSPTVEVVEVAGGHEVTITDSTGPHTIFISNGEQGPQGERGEKGEKGDPGDPASQIQSDWTQTDKTAADFIKNKPTDADALLIAIETELVEPIATMSGEILTDRNNTVIVL